jgi:hypothetical protein
MQFRQKADPMKPLFTLILCFLAFYGAVLTANAAGPSDSSLRTKSVDEDLILDEDPSSVLPKDKNPAVPSPVVNSPARAINPVAPAPASAPVPAPAANSSADSTGKEQSSSVPRTADQAAPKGQAVPPAPAKAESQARDTTKKIVDEDLILDGGEEDLLIQTKKTPPKTVGTGVAKTADSATAKTSADSTGVAMDQSGAQNQKPGATPSPNGQAALSEKPQAPPKAAPKIENARSINFAANLKEYRSPKLAMLMSLCVPGSGQIYAKSNLWAAGFLLVEAVIVGTGVVYSSKSKVQKAKAHKFADTAYSADKFETYTHDLQTNFVNRGDTTYSSIFFDSSDVLFLRDAKKSPGKRSDNFYNDISSKTSPYVRGWKDVMPNFDGGVFSISDSNIYKAYSTKTGPNDTNYLVYKNGDIKNASFGFSDYQLHYISMLDESRKLANYSRTAFVTLLINHLASAVMAGIEAKNHNDALLGQESVWQHIDIEQQFVNTGSETVSGYSIGVRF